MNSFLLIFETPIELSNLTPFIEQTFGSSEFDGEVWDCEYGRVETYSEEMEVTFRVHEEDNLNPNFANQIRDWISWKPFYTDNLPPNKTLLYRITPLLKTFSWPVIYGEPIAIEYGWFLANKVAEWKVKSVVISDWRYFNYLTRYATKTAKHNDLILALENDTLHIFCEELWVNSEEF